MSGFLANGGIWWKIMLIFWATTCNQVLGSSCSFRCTQQPTLFDYMKPRGCYCHSTCGGSLRCCPDKEKLCDNLQACMRPPKISGATHNGGKLFYAKYESIEYECKFHYELDGSSTRTCYGNNIWSRPPTCKYVSFVCSPPRVGNGRYILKKKQYVRGDSVVVLCDPGYVLKGPSVIYCGLYRWSDRSSCIRDRCARSGYCSKDATCHNMEYYARCVCNDGFTGSGYTCNRVPCYRRKCGTNEVCIDGGSDDGDACECKEGYLEEEGGCVKDACFEKVCHENAICERANGGVCTCNEGFEGDGTTCEKDPCFEKVCHENAICQSAEGGVCKCNDGFEGDGTACKKDPCFENACDDNAMCERAEGGLCKCKAGFEGDGTTCEKDPCFEKVCHENATCVRAEGVVCKCNEGFEGDGTACERIMPTCTEDCHPNATCTESPDKSYLCVCEKHFTGNGTHCEEIPCAGACHENAVCIDNSCVCQESYYGDGIKCEMIVESSKEGEIEDQVI